MNANELYLDKRKQVDNAIDILKQKMEYMDMAQKKDKKNYGYAGNAGHILEEIEELNDFMNAY